MIMHRFQVTNADYFSFLDYLVAAGLEVEALRHAPREGPGTKLQVGPLIYAFDGKHFSLRPDAEGDIWGEDWPVMQAGL